MSELAQKTFSFLYQKVPWRTVKNDSFASRPTLWINWFSPEKFSFRSFFGILSGEKPTGRVVKQIVHVDRTTIEESDFHFEWYDSWICLLTLNKISRILAEKVHEGCHYCILSAEMINYRKNIFFLEQTKSFNLF